MRFWHVFHGANTDTGLRVQFTLGDTTCGPDDILTSGTTVRDSTFPVPDYGVEASYVASFDHEPTSEDLAAAGIPTDDEMFDG
ncbi:hypothetical protein [Prescottella equi]